MTENKVKCLICGKTTTANSSYIGSHVKRVHNILIDDYIIKYYKNLDPEFKYEKCGFCNNTAIPNIIPNHLTYEYNINYNNGYLCGSENCRNDISILIFGKPYDTKSYEHIGCQSEYLSKLYKIDITEAKNLKRDLNRICTEKDKCSLAGYILRYGEEKGTKKYNERCEKIRKSNTIKWYIEKYGEIEGTKKYNNRFKNDNHYVTLSGYIYRYGEIEGTKKYNERCNHIGKTNTLEWYVEEYGEIEGKEKYLKSLPKRKSKESNYITKILNDLELKYKEEFFIKKAGKICDYYLENENIIIEYFGNYWHCNPLLYEKNYYNQRKKMFAYEIWEHDKQRLEKIFQSFDKKMSIIVIWGNTKMNKELLLKLITDIKDKNTIIYV